MKFKRIPRKQSKPSQSLLPLTGNELGDAASKAIIEAIKSGRFEIQIHGKVDDVSHQPIRLEMPAMQQPIQMEAVLEDSEPEPQALPEDKPNFVDKMLNKGRK